MTLSIIDVKKVREGSLDEYQATYALDNRLSIPVQLAVISGVGVKAVRYDGVELDAGYANIPSAYWVSAPSGRTVFTSEPSNYLTIFHGFQVKSFFTRGDIEVRNSSEDQIARHKFCSFKAVVMGPPLTGYWG